MMMWTLTDDQLILLDGHADDKMQAVIDGIKLARNCGANVPLVGEVISKAKAAGWLRIQWANGQFCPVCKASAGYAKHTRSGRYHSKGDSNHKKPLTMRGVCFESSCVFVKGSIDCCLNCDNTHGISHTLVNLIISRRLPIELRGDPRTIFKKDDERQCHACGQLMYESEMGMLSTLMGDGKYPGVCPHCGAKALAFGAMHRATGKFRMKEAAQAEIK